jgi:hypothetical protein
VIALERVCFVEGQLLRGCDLEELVRGFELLRSLHVRAVHQARGVALGFGVSLDATRRHVVVDPGAGYDRRGRDLVSGRSASVPAPIVDGRHLLVAASGCGVDFHWLEPERVRDELVLCACEAAAGSLGEPDLSVRIGARGPGAHIAAGRQDAKLVPTIQVDTSAAGFLKTPVYFATLAGTRTDLLLEVVNPTKTRFALQIRSVHFKSEPVRDLGKPLTVHWVGAEPASDD